MSAVITGDEMLGVMRAYLEGERALLAALPFEPVNRLVEALAAARSQGSHIYVMGNGGSAATASHFACDLNKGLRDGGPECFKVLCLNDNIPTMLAYANDVGYDDVFVEQLRNFLRPGDMVIGISCSGNSRNVVQALEYAATRNATTVALTGFDGGHLIGAADLAVIVPSDDMQMVEDVHLVLAHLIMRLLSTHSSR